MRPEPIALSDVVPVLRADLKIADPQPGRGESEIRVEDAATGKFLMLKGFELSLARMLNGRRTAEEVLTAAGQIGLPLSIESFNGFLRKLHKEGFLSHAAALAPLDITTWEARSEWNEEIRRLFQEALREARADRFVAAKSRLEALLARSPSTQEAQQLLHWVMERLRPEGGADIPPFSDVFAEAEKSWFAEGDQVSAVNERAAFDGPGPSLGSVGAAPRKSKKGLVIGAVAAAALGGVLLVPMPRTATAPFTLQPRAINPVTLLHGGTLAAIAVNEGQWVDKGATLARWDPAPGQKKLAALEARLAEVLKKNKPSAAAAKKLAGAQGKLDKATAAQGKAEAELEKVKAAAKGKKSAAVAKAEKKAAAATAAVAAAQKSVSALTVPLTAQAEVASIHEEVARAKLELAELAVIANADGFVKALAAKPGQVVEAGAVLARLEDSRTMKVMIAVPLGEKLAVGAPVQLKVGSIAAKAVVDKVEGASAEAPLDNAKGGFAGGATGESTFAGASKSLLGL